MSDLDTIRTNRDGKHAAVARDGRHAKATAKTQPMATIAPAKHTPGPWVAEQWACHARTTITTVTDNDGRRSVVAECRRGLSLDVALANARVIAVAPEMLLELKRIADGIAGGFIVRDPEIVSRSTWDAMVAAISAVIAKTEAMP